MGVLDRRHKQKTRLLSDTVTKTPPTDVPRKPRKPRAKKNPA